MPRSLDDLRALRPDLGFALYALTPKGAVTLEVHAPNEEIFSFTNLTEAAAIEAAFPEPAAPPPAPPPTDNRLTMSDFAPPKPAPSVFD